MRLTEEQLKRLRNSENTSEETNWSEVYVFENTYKSMKRNGRLFHRNSLTGKLEHISERKETV